MVLHKTLSWRKALIALICIILLCVCNLFWIARVENVQLVGINILTIIAMCNMNVNNGENELVFREIDIHAQLASWRWNKNKYRHIFVLQ